MHTPRVVKLCLEVCDHATELAELLDEHRAGGAGIHRDPDNVMRDLHAELADLLAAAREMRDDFEREARGLQQ